MNRETLDKIHSLSAEIKRQNEIVSEGIKTAQDRAKETKHTIERNGKEIEISEGDMWREVSELGEVCQSGLKLYELYPEIFEANKKANAAKDDLTKLFVTAFGFGFSAMGISEYLKLTEELFNLLLAERK